MARNTVHHYKSAGSCYKPRGHAINNRVRTMHVKIRTWCELSSGVLQNQNHQIDTRYHGNGIYNLIEPILNTT